MNKLFKSSKEPSFSLPAGISILLHISFIAVIFINITFMPKPKPVMQTAQPVKIVEAVKIDQSKVEKEINRLKQAELKKKQEEDARVRKLQQKAAEAKKARETEKKRLAKLQADKKKLEQKRIAEQEHAKKQLAELKAKQEAEEKRVKSIQAEAEKAKKKKLEEQKRLAELEKKRKAEEEKKALAEKERFQRETEKLMEQQLAAEQAQLKAARLQQLQSQIDKYTALITQAVGRHWIVPDNLGDETSCVLLIRVAPGGSVIDVKLVRSSGDSVLDRSAQSAVFKASPLPVPEDPELFDTFREIRLLVKPEGYLI